MDDIFGRLGRTIRSIFADDKPSNDPDYADAWRELNSYLDKESPFKEEEPRKQDKQNHQNQSRSYSGRTGATAKDWKNLELAPGADAATVRKAYKRLLTLYHPDRHSGDPEKQRLATEITARLNDSYGRIMKDLGE